VSIIGPHTPSALKRFPPSVARAKLIKVDSQEGKTERRLTGRRAQELHENSAKLESAANETIRI
jgi:hypothetical protein